MTQAQQGSERNTGARNVAPITGALEAGCMALALRLLQTAAYEIGLDGFASHEARERWLRRTERCRLVDMRCAWLLEDAIVEEHLDSVPALLAFVRALAPAASLATPRLGFALAVTEQMLTSEINFDAWAATLADCAPGGPSPTDSILARFEEALSNGLERDHGDLYPEIVRDLAEELEAADLLHELDAVPEALAIEIERVRNEALRICPDCDGPIGACVCGGDVTGERAFLASTDRRDDERRTLRELAAESIRASEETRGGEPVSHPERVAMLRAMLAMPGMVNDDDACARSIRVHGVDFTAAEIAAQLEAAHGRSVAARALALAAMASAHFEESAETRERAERIALRTMDSTSGRARREDIDHELEGLATVDGAAHSARSALEYALELDEAPDAARWIVHFGVESIESDDRARWAATCALDALTDCQRAAAGTHEDEELRAYLGLPASTVAYFEAAE